MFEPGSSYALATLGETTYDVNSGADPSYFPLLNVKSQKSYHYISKPTGDVDDEPLATIAGYFSSSNLASVSETDYSYDANYKARGIISRPTESRVLDPANTSNILAKTQYVYDEGGDYSLIDAGMDDQWSDPESLLRGNVTTTKTWVKDTDTWLSAHARYDNFGNLRKAWDVSGDAGKFTETEYTSATRFAYPTKVTAPAPDPGNTTGTNQTSSVSTAYDFNTGLPKSVTDDFGQVTTMEYVDPLLPPLRG